MERTTDELCREHKNILAVIEALEKHCGDVENGAKPDKDFFEKAVAFIRGYADRFHHAKEEDVLFTALDEDGVRMRCNPTRQMLLEHSTGRSFVKGMERALEDGDAAALAENSRGYAGLLKDHIFKEDNVLYPMAEEALDPQTQEAIRVRFRRINARFARDNEGFLAFVEGLRTRAV